MNKKRFSPLVNSRMDPGNYQTRQGYLSVAEAAEFKISEL
jgi:hypothetical protein